MKEKLTQLLQEGKDRIAAVRSEAELQEVKALLLGKQGSLTGLLKELGEQVCEKNGIECRPVMINIGEKDDGKDDRLYYFDLKKEWPNDLLLGSRVTIVSNDMMVADVRVA